MSRVLGIDFGDRRVGIAVSDPDRKISLPGGTISWSRHGELVEKLQAICREKEVRQVVVGLPRSLDGGDGPRAKKTRKWAAEIETVLELPVSLWDERLTSRMAEREIHAMGGKTGRDKGRVDEIAATLILQSYLDSLDRGDR